MEVRPIDANALKEDIIGMPPFEIDRHDMLEMIDDQNVLSLNTLRDEIYQDAVAHGLWEDNRDEWPTDCAKKIENETDELWCAGELWEDDGVDLEEPDMHYCEELADVVIMCFSVAGKLGIDIDAAIRRKMAVNKNRPWKHGKE